MADTGRDQFTEGLKKDMYVYGMEKYDSIPTIYDKIFEVIQSDSAYEKETDVSGMGNLTEKKPSEKVVFSNPMEGYTIISKNRTFADGVEFQMELVMDIPKEKIANIVTDEAASWAESVIRTKEEFAARFFNEGGLLAGSDIFDGTITGVIDDPSGKFAYDGKPFFNLSNSLRPLRKGGPGTNYNGLGLAITVPNLQAAYNLMTISNNRNMRNQRVSIIPDTLLIPPSLRFTARTILQSERMPGTVNNDINPVQNLVQPIEWQYLTNQNSWFLGVKGKGLKWHDRMAMTFDFYRDLDSMSYKATVIARWGAKVTNWRYWVGNNFLTA